MRAQSPISGLFLVRQVSGDPEFSGSVFSKKSEAVDTALLSMIFSSQVVVFHFGLTCVIAREDTMNIYHVKILSLLGVSLFLAELASSWTGVKIRSHR